ncbi:indole-3-glycerol phosphate synthase TrpC [Neobacillus mesonae]|uniref:indole-3-glycerol phosphate synthase TrpC n=1 Tax=Neobacillus mesonae TaxID=1193713 RepID=UPI00203C00E2|nr:indole-3-glycerol phosphate synthase TrpC [Neobacillus mesonae]MCM3568858.1 indole-3-glycerol phosphate synthase TrpC [Neobacillus mesonae]
MGTILDKIIEQKKKEVELLRKNENSTSPPHFKKRSFIEKLEKAKELAIISEFKRSSPSKGVINDHADPAEQAAIYERNGASAISVLTDHTFFKGSFSDLAAVREAVDLPILCKDFIIDTLQIDQARGYGADIVLLIVAALPEEKLHQLYRYAKDLGLEVLMEVHNEAELKTALTTGAKLIGVNNRDLKTFNVSLEVTEKLAAIVKESGAFLISESGLHHDQDVERVRNAGANGILVGEALMKSSNLKQTFENFRQPLAAGTK